MRTRQAQQANNRLLPKLYGQDIYPTSALSECSFRCPEYLRQNKMCRFDFRIRTCRSSKYHPLSFFILAAVIIEPLEENVKRERLSIVVALEALDLQFLEDVPHSGGLDAFDTYLGAEKRCEA